MCYNVNSVEQSNAAWLMSISSFVSFLLLILAFLLNGNNSQPFLIGMEELNFGLHSEKALVLSRQYALSATKPNFRRGGDVSFRRNCVLKHGFHCVALRKPGLGQTDFTRVFAAAECEPRVVVVILGLRRSVNEIFALLGCYAAA